MMTFQMTSWWMNNDLVTLTLPFMLKLDFVAAGGKVFHRNILFIFIQEKLWNIDYTYMYYTNFCATAE